MREAHRIFAKFGAFRTASRLEYEAVEGDLARIRITAIVAKLGG